MRRYKACERSGELQTDTLWRSPTMSGECDAHWPSSLQDIPFSVRVGWNDFIVHDVKRYGMSSIMPWYDPLPLSSQNHLDCYAASVLKWAASKIKTLKASLSTYNDFDKKLTPLLKTHLKLPQERTTSAHPRFNQIFLLEDLKMRAEVVKNTIKPVVPARWRHTLQPSSSHFKSPYNGLNWRLLDFFGQTFKHSHQQDYSEGFCYIRGTNN